MTSLAGVRGVRGVRAKRLPPYGILGFNKRREVESRARPPITVTKKRVSATRGLPGRALCVAPRPGMERRIPTSTYRLQLHQAFTLEDARRLVPYLERLGVGAIYLSPCLQARPGSPHGYDITDHTRISAELGGDAAFAALRGRGGRARHDARPRLRAEPHGRRRAQRTTGGATCSRTALARRTRGYFDIDWKPIKPELEGKRAAADARTTVRRRRSRAASSSSRFADGAARAPLLRSRAADRPAAVRRSVLRPATSRRSATRTRTRASSRASRRAAGNLPPRIRRPPRSPSACARRTSPASGSTRLGRAPRRASRATIEQAVACGQRQVAGDAASFDALHELLEARPTGSRTGKTRAFTRSTTAASSTSTTSPRSAWRTRRCSRRRTAGAAARSPRERSTGLRIDHVDGLLDPRRYLERLRGARRARRVYDRRREDPRAAARRCPTTWPVDGTTGYEFLNELNGLFVDAARGALRARLRALHRPRAHRFAIVALRLQAADHARRRSRASCNVLADALDRISERDRRSRDFTLRQPARRARARSSPASRCTAPTSTRDGWHGRRPRDRSSARSPAARRRNPAMERSIFDFVRDVLLAARRRRSEAEHARRASRVRDEASSSTPGPVQAKGVEDTAFYRYNLLASLNEVGGDPAALRGDRRGVPRGKRCDRARALAPRHARHRDARHQARRGRARAARRALGDAARLGPRGRAAGRRMHAARSAANGGLPSPDRNDEYLFYQTLVGVWPRTARAPRRRRSSRGSQRLHDQGAHARRRCTRAGSTPTQRVRGGARRRSSSARSDGRRPRASSTTFAPFQRPRRAARHAELARAGSSLKLTSPGRAGHLSGHRALGSEPRRSRQPPAGRLRHAARESSRSSIGRRTVRRSRRAFSPSCSRRGRTVA